MVETLATYPYEPRIFGLPLDEMLARISAGKNKEVIRGGSGRALRFDYDPNQILIEDRENPNLRLWMRVNPDSGELRFGGRTKISPLEDPSKRHPDLFAGTFVRTALKFFENQGLEIKTCRVQWDPGTDNFEAFVEQLHASVPEDEIAAAWTTWTGQTLSLLGFTNVIYLRVHDDFGQTDSYVDVIFSRS